MFQEIIGRPPDPNAAYANGKVLEFEYGTKLARKISGWIAQPAEWSGSLWRGLGVAAQLDQHRLYR